MSLDRNTKTLNRDALTSYLALTEQSPIAEIAGAFNAVKTTELDVKTLAKRGKAKLLAFIHSESAVLLKAIKAAEQVAADKAAGNCGVMSAMTRSLGDVAAKPVKNTKPARAPKTAAPAEEKAPRVTIRTVSEDLLKEVAYHDDDKRPFGLAYDEILARVHTQFEGAKTTVACLRWYAVHMRERGVQLPHRPRVAPAAAMKKD